MNVLVDTNILSRIAQLGHPQHVTALAALDHLRARGDIPSIVPQNLYEFWVVCTRPAGENGLGLGTSDAREELTKAKSLFPDTPAMFPEWERLVITIGAKGKPRTTLVS